MARKRMLPSGVLCHATIVGDELRITVDISHNPLRILGQRTLRFVTEEFALMDEHDVEAFEELAKLLDEAKGGLQ